MPRSIRAVPKTDLGRALVALCDQRGLSLAELAERLEVSEGRVRQYLRQEWLTVETRDRLVGVLGEDARSLPAKILIDQ